MGRAEAVLDDLPGDIAPGRWSSADALAIVEKLAHLHASFANQTEALTNAGLAVRLDSAAYPWQTLTKEQSLYFEEGQRPFCRSMLWSRRGSLRRFFCRRPTGWW